MRSACDKHELKKAFDRVISESKTGAREILIERHLENTRHVEVQIAGDGTNFVHLYERDCSTQRKYQKIIEEAPCTFINNITQEKLHNAACTLARAAAYNNIGTVEFLVTPEEDFYFLEMNTRLQVEHGVTELITGIDLVALQIEIAQSGILPVKQKDVSCRGHAIECRLYAEDAQNNFLPSTGTISHLHLPNGPFVRYEHDLHTDIDITPYFDPMIAKILTHNNSRENTRKNMLAILKNIALCGVTTNLDFLQTVLNSNAFIHGNLYTQYLNSHDLNNHDHVRTLLEIHETAKSILEKDISTHVHKLIVSKQKQKQKKQVQHGPKQNLWKALQWQ